MNIRTFMNRKNRDAAYKEEVELAKKTNEACAKMEESLGLPVEWMDIVTVTRTSIKNQLLHPMYVEDYEKETGIILSERDKGLGNTIYKTPFSTLYHVEIRNVRKNS